MEDASRALALTITCMLWATCSCTADGTKKDGEVCEAMGECEGNLICSDGRCTPPCNGDDECGEGRFCNNGLCAPSECGNGLLEGTEQCDAGQQNADSSGCTTECKLNVCGDEKPHAGVEECDDGPRNSDVNPDACRTTCKLAHCGDGVRDSGEECDDGYADACGSCNADCSGDGDDAVCGDGIRCPELEVCDDGSADACGSCNGDCSGAGSGAGVCGDGVRCPESGETCDDGYTDACGSCNANCSGAGSGAGVCGDGVWCPESGEACDDGYTDACGSCNADCSGAGDGAVCGDGVRCPEYEACDDGNAVDDLNGCDEECERYDVCGNGVHETLFEACDDGYTDACGSCNADCTGAGSGAGVCGDGDRCPEYEACDDGNSIPGDGCTAWCSEDTGCGDASCNSNGPRFPVSGEPQLGRTGYTEPVVADTQTGLEWQGCPAGLSGSACSTGSVATMVWEDAVSYCIDLVWNGLADWYLPDEYELQSIVDYSVFDPATGLAAFPATPSDRHWTSSTYGRDPSQALAVYFRHGYVFPNDKGDSYPVRCVRRGGSVVLEPVRLVRTSGSQPVVRDTTTGLTWQGCEASLSGSSCETGTPEQLSWDDAGAYCDSLEWAGVSDWYLPSAKELLSIVDNRRNVSPWADPAAFPATTAVGFWTSSSFASSSSSAWCIYFYNGNVSNADKGTSYHVRCVRRGS